MFTPDFERPCKHGPFKIEGEPNWTFTCKYLKTMLIMKDHFYNGVYSDMTQEKLQYMIDTIKEFIDKYMK